MTPEEREQMDELCKRIQEERDPQKFSELVAELDELLSTKEERLTSEPRPNAPIHQQSCEEDGGRGQILKR